MSELMNPIQRKIASGVSPIIAFLSEATCGEACWEAREDICRCSCGGKNHGCMRTADGIRPVRTAKIDGMRYELKAVGENLYSEAETINRANGPRSVQKITADLTYTYWWDSTDRGAPARVKPATKAQLAAWPELAQWREEHAILNAEGRHAPIEYKWPYLLWVRL